MIERLTTNATTNVVSFDVKTVLFHHLSYFLYQLQILVTPVPSFGKKRISNFKNRQDLIDANMASVHLVRNSVNDAFFSIIFLHK